MSAGNPNTDPGMPQGFLLSGDAEAMAAMTPDRIEMLREMVGGLGLKLTTLREAPLPILMRRDGFEEFASSGGHAQRTAVMAWNLVALTHHRRVGHDHQPPLPPIIKKGPNPETGEGADFWYADLRAIKTRLGASPTEVWASSGRITTVVNFLARLVESKVDNGK